MTWKDSKMLPQTMTPTEITSGINMELILSVLLLAAGVCGTGYISDKRKWNNGICKKSGKPWKYFDSDYGGSRGYKDWAGNYIWISFNLDKDYNHYSENDI